MLLESVRAARKHALAAILEHAVPLEISGAAVVIGLPRAQVRTGVLGDRDNRTALEAAFERLLGQKPAFTIKEQEPAQPMGEGTSDAPLQSVAEQKQQARSRAAASRLTLGREHPNVRAAVELLGGEIEEVSDLGEE